MRLIDADALIDAMYHEAFETDSDMQRWDSGCWIRYKMFENAIDNAPTIEPKQGHWVEDVTYGRGALNIERFVRCSECGYVPRYKGEPIIPTTGTMLFCPNCGARMK